MINKELLSEVLKLKECEYKNGILFYKDKHDARIWKEYNIYELAHECKEWAFDKKYSISVWKERVFEYTSETTIKREHFKYTGEILSNNYDVKDIHFTDKFETEQDYIFASCELIMEQTK